MRHMYFSTKLSQCVLWSLFGLLLLPILFQIPLAAQDIQASAIAWYPNVQNFAWSPDHQILAAAMHNKTVSLYNASLTMFQDFKAPGSIYRVGWSPDGSFLAASYSTEAFSNDSGVAVIIWNIKTKASIQTEGFPIWEGDFPVVWSPDGQWIALSSPGTVYLIEALTGKTLNIFDSIAYVYASIRDIIWSPDGVFLYILYGDGMDYLRRWNPRTGGIDEPFKKSVWSFATHMALSHDRRKLVFSADEDLISIVDLDTGQIERTFVIPDDGGRDGRYRDLAWSADDTEIVGVIFGATIYVWDSTTGLVKGQQELVGIQRAPGGTYIFEVEIRDDGRKLVYTTRNGDPFVIIDVPFIDP